MTPDDALTLLDSLRRHVQRDDWMAVAEFDDLERHLREEPDRVQRAIRAHEVAKFPPGSVGAWVAEGLP